jgi:hypothetical protein
LVRIESAEGAIDRNLLVIGPQAVAVGVRIGEKTRLKDGVSRGLHTRHHVRRGEGGLFYLGKIVLRLQ